MFDDLYDELLSCTRKRISSRANLLFLKLCLGGVSEKIWIGGNSLNAGECHDIDVFFPKQGYPLGGFKKDDVCLEDLNEEIDSFNTAYSDKMGAAIVKYDSKNAISVEFNGVKYQFCRYQKESCDDLIKSFDYAHIQIGVEVNFEEDGEENQPKISAVFYTEDYVKAMVTQNSWYTGSDYPLGSLFRAEKYKRYGQISPSEYKKTVIKTLTDLIKRGYADYEDFKDSIGAIDLLLFDRSTADALWEYFQICCRRGLIYSVASGKAEMLNNSQFLEMMTSDKDPTVPEEEYEPPFVPSKEGKISVEDLRKLNEEHKED